MCGPVAISTKGIPSLSNLKVGRCSWFLVLGSWLTFLAESSSNMMASIVIFPVEISMYPSWAISAVRWKPVVFDPSITVFRMTWVTGKILQFSKCEIWIAIFRASLLIAWGGSSSSSTRQFVS